MDKNIHINIYKYLYQYWFIFLNLYKVQKFEAGKLF